MEFPLKPEIAEGMVLPANLGNAIPRSATHVVFLDYSNRKFTLKLQRHGNGLIKVYGKDWKYFLAMAAVPPPWPKICLKQIQLENMFEVQFYDLDGLEYRLAEDGESYIHSCLVELTVPYFTKLTLSYQLLESLNGNGDRESAKVCKVTGPVMDATVQVCYDVCDFKVNDELLTGPTAGGFEGTNWVRFCVDNDFRPQRKLKVSKSGDGSFVCDVFKTNAVCAHFVVERVVDVGTSYASPDSGSDWDEDYANFVKQHILYTADVAQHDVEAAINEANSVPHVYLLMTLQLHPHNLRTRCLTIPKKFVGMHQMQKYLWAKVHYQTAWYPGKVFIRWDSRRPGDDTHVLLQVNWKKVIEDSGKLVNDNVNCEFTLQFNIDKCEGDVADFDIIF